MLRPGVPLRSFLVGMVRHSPEPMIVGTDVMDPLNKKWEKAGGPPFSDTKPKKKLFLILAFMLIMFTAGILIYLITAGNLMFCLPVLIVVGIVLGYFLLKGLF